MGVRVKSGRIVFVCNALRLGGSQSVLRELVRLAVSANMEAIVASRGGELETEMQHLGARTVTILVREGTARRTGSRLGSAVKTGASLMGVAQLAALLRPRKTLVHASQPWPVSLAASAALLAHAPLIWHAHGTTAVEMPPAWLPTVRRASAGWVAITPEVEQAMRLLRPGPGPSIRTIRSPIALDFSPLEEAAPLPGIIGVMSTLTLNKRSYLRACLQAARNLAAAGSHIHLKVVGDGPDRMAFSREARELEAITANLEISILGSSVQPWASLADCEIVIGMGLVALEAAARGHNVVCASSDGLGGHLTPQTYHRLFETNFTGRGIAELRTDALTRQLRAASEAGPNPQLRRIVVDDHGAASARDWVGLWTSLLQ